MTLENNCCHCFNPPAALPHTKCDSCKLIIHLKCIQLSSQELDLLSGSRSQNIKVFCNRCNSNLTAFNEIKELINSMKSSLEQRISKFENALLVANNSTSNREEIIQESVDRMLRSSNLILANVAEKSDVRDEDVVNDILEKIDSAVVVSPENVTRIGRKINDRPRLIKIKLKNAETVKVVLRKKSKLQNTEFSHVHIFDDKTTSQRQYLKDLRNELHTRTDNGEANLTIKYVKGLPHILSRQPHENESNSTTHLN